MCANTEVLNQTSNGCLMICPECRIYHLTFGNFYLEFTENELTHFSVFLEKINVDYWESQFCNCTMKRKLAILSTQVNLSLLLNRTELEELKKLIYYKENKNTLLKVVNIAYDFYKN
ncbi:DUF6686 family protein [Maribacter dokdonensis]|uniref:DUF6686 family protein n=1 Tax=Maribacter dokdonensis TaxID=320912 RepID=UPI003D663125